ncbi:hypothetical protein [Neobacillus sp. 19]|uniref:hypothetical protein n=1 Tax=Neobacillus sp. 19 TaxID=3394458 RepID=UPI003BF6A4C5
MYKEVNRSWTISLLLFVILLGLVVGKVILAHEKTAAYKEAMMLFQSGDGIAAEKKLLAAKRNPAVSDHDQEIDRILADLANIQEKDQEVNRKTTGDQGEDILDQLVDTYSSWHANVKKRLTDIISTALTR